MKYNVAVVGATGLVGQEIVELLSYRNFPVGNISLVGSKNSAGQVLPFGGAMLSLQQLEDIVWDDVDIAFCAANEEVLRELKQLVTDRTIIIDKSSLYRLDPNVPLVVPEVNAEDIGFYSRKNIIASPNCCVIPLAMVLNSLHKLQSIKRVVISTYQSISGAGKSAIEKFYEQVRDSFFQEEGERSQPGLEEQHVHAFNVVSQIGELDLDGNSGEETKITSELHRLIDPMLAISVTAVRVPVFVGHSFSVNVEFEEDVSLEEAHNALSSAPGVHLLSDVVTPLDAVGADEVYVSRLRQNPSQARTVDFWVVADNLRKGAALNAVQIAEYLAQILKK